jgi:hypothetical protein
MKKFILVIMLLVGNIALTFAQNDTVIYMANHPNSTDICLNRFDRVLVYGAENCQNYLWTVRYNSGYEQHPEGNPLVITGTFGDNYRVEYNGCGLWWDFYLHFTDDRWVPTSFTHEIWKHQGETIMLQAVQNVGDSTHYDFYWSTGEGGYGVWEIPISEPVVYTCQIPAMCGTAIRTFIVRDNVELYRVTVDLATNLNKVTWQTTEAQAEYISEVKVERDGMVVGTAPYEDGQFIDNIGSENAARNYRLTAITTEGDECPIPSYQYGTLHVDYSPNASNPNKLNMAWTPPFIEEGAPYSVSYFRICKYDPETNEVTVVDQIAANITIGSYDVSLFDGGYAVVAAMFNEGKDYEELSFSNLTDFLLGIEENEGQQCRVYPNPANDRFTVEGTGMMRITNVLGQEIIAKEIDGKETVALPKGLYFVQLNGMVRKIVVE